jgi:hypothetical protein
MEGGRSRVHKRPTSRIPIFPVRIFHNAVLPNALRSLLLTTALNEGSLYANVQCYSAEEQQKPTEMRTRTVNNIQDPQHI